MDKNMSEYLIAFILGLIEGITEFLPISSTGHLILFSDLLGFNSESSKVFDIAIQLGAILAVCYVYKSDLIHTVKTIKTSETQKFLINLFCAFLPTAILGLLLHKTIKLYLFNPLNVGIMLILGGWIIYFIERKERTPKINHINEMKISDAVKVGFCQSLAMIPGTSRSGATIMGGMLLGLSREVATKFSFFLAIPTMFSAVSYDLYKNWHLLTLHDLHLIVIGFITAFISGLFAVKLLIKYISNHSFMMFAFYRIIFGAIVVFYYQLKLS